VHIQLNLDDSAVAVVNRTYIPRRGMRYEAEVVAMTGASLLKKSGTISLDTTDVKEVASLRSLLRETTGVSFVLLRLMDKEGKPLSQNVYWMSPRHDFTELRAMPSARVHATVSAVEKKAGYAAWTIRFTNVTSGLAFFLNPQIVAGGEEVLPSYWSDNYFSIPAGQSITVRVSCPMTGLAGRRPQLRLEGWNIRPQDLRLPP
jgi:hypothetical protein